MTTIREYKMPLRKAIDSNCIFAFFFSCFSLFIAVFTFNDMFLKPGSNVDNPFFTYTAAAIFITTMFLLGLNFYHTFLYVRLYGDRIEIRNFLLPFCFKTYYYGFLKENMKVSVEPRTPSDMQVYSTRKISLIRNGNKAPGILSIYYLRLVSSEDCVEIAQILKSEGIEVEISH